MSTNLWKFTESAGTADRTENRKRRPGHQLTRTGTGEELRIDAQFGSVSRRAGGEEFPSPATVADPADAVSQGAMRWRHFQYQVLPELDSHPATLRMTERN
ncbi:hypothetical protein ACFXG4_09495 [Nocardia sp. NPDC059246]|uniref:hypothetical protein n=1 Tax=unclassified Nocardia TaxID=2637762 RepID=UPI0036A7B305